MKNTKKMLNEADLQNVFGGASPDTGSTTGLQQKEGDSCSDGTNRCSCFSLVKTTSAT